MYSTSCASFSILFATFLSDTGLILVFKYLQLSEYSHKFKKFNSPPPQVFVCLFENKFFSLKVWLIPNLGISWQHQIILLKVVVRESLIHYSFLLRLSKIHVDIYIEREANLRNES